MIGFLYKSLRRLMCVTTRVRFKSCGRDVIFDPLSSTFSFKNISIGRKVFIGGYAYFRSTHSQIQIGDNVLFGPGVYILGGNHIFDVPGKLMTELSKSDDHIDSDVIIKNDVWVGARATILSGVTINEGAIIAAGSIVSSDVPAYEIHGGTPNKKLKDRFSSQALNQHKMLLGLD